MNITANLTTAYLDFKNNYLSVEVFAEHNQISVELATLIIKEGRIKHEINCAGFDSLPTASQKYFDGFMLK